MTREQILSGGWAGVPMLRVSRGHVRQLWGWRGAMHAPLAAAQHWLLTAELLMAPHRKLACTSPGHWKGDRVTQPPATCSRPCQFCGLLMFYLNQTAGITWQYVTILPRPLPTHTPAAHYHHKAIKQWRPCTMGGWGGYNTLVILRQYQYMILE